MTTSIDLAQARYPALGDHRVVIPGGTGQVGEGLLRAWLRTGAEVIVPSRTAGRVAHCKTNLGELAQSPQLHFVVGDYSTFDSAEETAQLITERFGPVSDVVISIGGWRQGKPLWEITEEEWQRSFVELTTAHVATVRAWIPRLPAEGSYQLILDGRATTATPGSAISNMAQAALLMMRQVLAAELGGQRRVFAHILGPVATRARVQTESSWVSPHEVGLVSTGVAAATSLPSTDFELGNKEQLLAVLRHLNVYPVSFEGAK